MASRTQWQVIEVDFFFRVNSGIFFIGVHVVAWSAQWNANHAELVMKSSAHLNSNLTAGTEFTATNKGRGFHRVLELRESFDRSHAEEDEITRLRLVG
jgi:hypothetical protein